MKNRRRKRSGNDNRAENVVPVDAPGGGAASFEFTTWAGKLVAELQASAKLHDDELLLLRSQIEEPPTAPHPAARDPLSPEIVRDRATLKKVAERLAGAEAVAIDLETSHLDPPKGEIVGVGLATANHTFYIPTAHRFEDGRLRPDQLPVATVAKELALNKLPLVAHNAKFERRWLQHHTGATCEFVGDTMLAARLLDPHLKADLKEVSMRELDVPNWALTPEEMKAFGQVVIDRAARYCARDAAYTLQIFFRQRTSDSFPSFLNDVETKVMPIVAELEDHGYAVDMRYFNELRSQIEPEHERLLSAIREATNPTFNPASPKQLKALLYEDWGLPVTRDRCNRRRVAGITIAARAVAGDGLKNWG